MDSSRCPFGDACELYLTSNCPNRHPPLCRNGSGCARARHPTSPCTFSHAHEARARPRVPARAAAAPAPAPAHPAPAVVAADAPAVGRAGCGATAALSAVIADPAASAELVRALLTHLMATPATRAAVQPVLQEFVPSEPILEMEDVFDLASHPAVDVLLDAVYEAGARHTDKDATLFKARGDLINACVEALPVDMGIPEDDDAA